MKEYYKLDHTHCWNQTQPPACGIKTKHKVCCLCEEPNVKEDIITIPRSKLLEIVGKKAHESDGWENARKESCCPGDDWANGYNRAKTEMRKKINKL